MICFAFILFIYQLKNTFLKTSVLSPLLFYGRCFLHFCTAGILCRLFPEILKLAALRLSGCRFYVSRFAQSLLLVFGRKDSPGIHGLFLIFSQFNFLLVLLCGQIALCLWSWVWGFSCCLVLKYFVFYMTGQFCFSHICIN